MNSWDVAKLLAAAEQSVAPSDAQLRRSVSTAYYALFHTVLRAGATVFSLPQGSNGSGYAILYRSFDHGRMKRVCDEIAKPALSPSMRRTLRRPAIYHRLRAFATAFVSLQQSRHVADYDPHVVLQIDDATEAIDEAERAIDDFIGSPPDEVFDVLALLLAGGRADPFVGSPKPLWPSTLRIGDLAPYHGRRRHPIISI